MKSASKRGGLNSRHNIYITYIRMRLSSGDALDPGVSG
jgi:hypothetical protein